MSGGGDYVEESPGERALADLSEDQWEDYQDRFIPIEHAFMDRVDDIRDERPLAVGRGAATATQAYDDAYDTVNNQNMQRGAAPSSGAFMAGLDSVGMKEADTKGRMMVGADRETEERYYAGKQQVVNLGRGQSTQASLGMRRSAGLDAATARSDARAASTVTNAKWGATGTLAGVGTRMVGEKKGWFKK